MGLKEDGIYLLKVNGFDAIAHSFEERSKTKVASLAKDAFGRTNNEGEGILGERVVTKASTIELAEDKGFHVFRGELWHEDGVSNAAFNVLVNRKGESGKKRRLTNEDEIVVFGEVFEKEP
jgi:hypothetical protein